MLTIALIFGFGIGLVVIAALAMLLLMRDSRVNSIDSLRYRGLFVLSAIFVIAYQCIVFEGLSATSLSSAIENHRLRFDIAHLAIVLIVSFISLYLKPRYYRWIISIIFVYAAVMSLANHITETTVAYQQINGLAKLTGPFQSTLSILDGERSGIGLFRQVFYVALMLTLLIISWKQRKLQDKQFSYALSVYSLIQLIMASIQVFYVEPNHLGFFPIAGFAFAIFSLLIVYQQIGQQTNLLVSLKHKESALTTERSYRQIAEDQVLMLSKTFDESNSIKHIIDTNGRILLCNSASHHFWGRNLELDSSCDLRELLNTMIQLPKSLPELKTLDGEITFEQLQLNQPYVNQTAAMVTHLNLTISPLSHLPEREPQVESRKLYVVSLYDVSKTVYLQNAIKYVAQGVSSDTGKVFFDELVVNLQKLLDTQYVFIGLVDDPEHPSKVETLSLAAHGMISDNFTYDLQYTPCENVIGNDACCYPHNIQDLYPEDQLLIDMNIEGYVGAPIVNDKKKTIGILVALSESPLRHVDQLNQIMDIFSARASAEMMRMRSEEEVRRLAYEDYLTGLPNRAVSMDYLSATIRNLPNHSNRSILVMIDFDHFKRINDALGHDVGDEVIRIFGLRLQEYFGDQFFIARLGGDEFVLLKELSARNIKQRAREWGKEILDKISAPITVGDHELELNSSLGIVIIPDDGDNVFDILRAAEIALYKAKANGRKQFIIFDPKDRENVQQRHIMEGKIRKALDKNEFEPFYQQQVNADGQIVSAEALARWIDPIDGIISPAEFISIAEETGLINQIGLVILEKSVALIAQYRNFFIANKISMSVNISPWQFARHDFLSSILTTLKKHSVDPEQLTLELTESALLANLEEARVKLSKLRNLGFKVALDDFGTGYSSLAYLRELEIDELKIDKAFVDELQANVSHPLVSSMISIGNNLDLRVVAEGVETKEQSDKLIELGCPVFQGYLFSKPVESDVFIQQLRNQYE